MSGIFGKNIRLSIFGESHGKAVGMVIDNLPSGLNLDMDFIYKEMERRAPGRDKFSTARKEADKPEIISGVFEGKTTGTPLCVNIKNSDKKSKDYSKLKNIPRPGHADYPGNMKYFGFNDYRGGGHFSGRLTAPLVFAGSIAKLFLKKKNITVGAHIKSIKNICDEDFDKVNLNKSTLEKLYLSDFPVLNEDIEGKMKEEIIKAKETGDSVGGVIEASVIGLEAGYGEPFFDSVESQIAHMMFSVPAVKGIEFGEGFNMSEMYGSECNDEYDIKDEKIVTTTNNNGGITGGITNGMPIVFKVAIKPTPSISKKQKSIHLEDKTKEEMVIEGRHDPCIVKRAIPVIEAATAIVVMDMILGREKQK